MLKILVVDDDPSVRHLTRLMVQKFGYQPVEATNGREAEQAALELQPVLILLDIMMPVQDGYQTVRNLRARGYTGAITMMSAVPEEVGAKQAAACGANNYLPKPVNREQLKLYVNDAVAKRADSQEAM